jgi:hypothetical protein
MSIIYNLASKGNYGGSNYGSKEGSTNSMPNRGVLD